MNPARHLGTAVIGGDSAQIGQIWIYCAGPGLGAIAAAVVYKNVLAEKES